MNKDIETWDQLAREIVEKDKKIDELKELAVKLYWMLGDGICETCTGQTECNCNGDKPFCYI